MGKEHNQNVILKADDIANACVVERGCGLVTTDFARMSLVVVVKVRERVVYVWGCVCVCFCDAIT